MQQIPEKQSDCYSANVSEEKKFCAEFFAGNADMHSNFLTETLTE